ncbi:hypothetical protein EJB05_15458 [Eragrostis curvula]|uniref:BZIP domain-containing protein n=1 Tax=Eragrostis curvula TaxID=38414 RepID=A0A5J9W0E4_9POAL|nr:hypothetical protein EJB05_15458 [Eragrostis curvula]
MLSHSAFLLDVSFKVVKILVVDLNFKCWYTHPQAPPTVHPEISQGSYAQIGGTRNLPQKKFRGGGGNRVQNAYTSARLPASSSSMERSPSDDDDMDGEVEILGFRIPDAEKLSRRKASNRESARRSRSRKAAHMKDLEDQVAHLRVENSLLLTRLDALNQKYKAAAVDKRVLRAEMETLRTKIKMAEDTVNRLIGTNRLPSTIVPNTPSFSNMPFVVGPPSHATPPGASSVPITNTNFYTTTAATDAIVSNTYMPIDSAIVNGSSDQIAASRCATAMELLEKRVMSDDMPASSSGPEAAPLADAVEVANMEMH